MAAHEPYPLMWSLSDEVNLEDQVVRCRWLRAPATTEVDPQGEGKEDSLPIPCGSLPILRRARPQFAALSLPNPANTAVGLAGPRLEKRLSRRQCDAAVPPRSRAPQTGAAICCVCVASRPALPGHRQPIRPYRPIDCRGRLGDAPSLRLLVSRGGSDRLGASG